MNLFYRKTGAGSPLIILHGLYGSSDNWYSIGRLLAADNTVYMVDQRNHGNSPHHPVHNYKALAEDLNEFMDRQGIMQASVIGHSMGGKTALAFGLNYPEKVNKMIVVDISPLGYPASTSGIHSSHRTILKALKSLNPETISNRETADDQLGRFIESPAIRQFLLKNLKRSGDGGFRWLLNLDAIEKNLEEIYAAVIPVEETVPGQFPPFPLLFIKGEKSGYIGNHDEEAIRYYYPGAEIAVVKDAGHWVHSEQPAFFLSLVQSFLKKGSRS